METADPAPTDQTHFPARKGFDQPTPVSGQTPSDTDTDGVVDTGETESETLPECIDRFHPIPIDLLESREEVQHTPTCDNVLEFPSQYSVVGGVLEMTSCMNEMCTEGCMLSPAYAICIVWTFRPLT